MSPWTGEQNKNKLHILELTISENYISSTTGIKLNINISLCTYKWILLLMYRKISFEIYDELSEQYLHFDHT